MLQESPIQLLQRQRLLLQMEYYAEKEAFRKQTEAAGMQRKVKRGDAWFPLRVGKRFYNGLNQLCIEVFRTQDGISNITLNVVVRSFSLSLLRKRKVLRIRKFS